MDRLKGKVAILSGAARGMGCAEGVLCAREGACLVPGDAIDREVTGLAGALYAEHWDEVAIGLRLDVTASADWTTAVAAAQNRWGGVAILVNKAGIASGGTAETKTENERHRTNNVNQTGTWLGMKAVIPSMRARGEGSIVNISSIGGLVGTPAFAAYHATRGAVSMLAKHGAVAFGIDNIRWNTIFPGSIATPMPEELVPTSQADNAPAQTCPLGRIRRPDGIAYAALYLASEEASYVTGVDLTVDVGFMAA